MLFARPLPPETASAEFQLNPFCQNWSKSVGNGRNQSELLVCIFIGIAIAIGRKWSEIVRIWQRWLHQISTKSIWLEVVTICQK